MRIEDLEQHGGPMDRAIKEEEAQILPGAIMHFTNITAFQDEEGGVWLGELWAFDLAQHAIHEPELMLCCPVEPMPRGRKDLRRMPLLEQPGRLHPVRRDHGLGSTLRNLLVNRRLVRAAAAKADMVRNGGAGWAVPLAWHLLTVWPSKRSYFWHMNIESSTWLLNSRRDYHFSQVD